MLTYINRGEASRLHAWLEEKIGHLTTGDAVVEELARLKRYHNDVTFYHEWRDEILVVKVVLRQGKRPPYRFLEEFFAWQAPRQHES